MRILKVCAGTWENASRDKRELSVCEELGYTTMVLAKGNNEDRGRKDFVDGFVVYRYTTKPLGDKVPSFINRILSLFIWALYVKKLSPDVISGHDILGLSIGWIASIFIGKKKRPQLVYDSHEFEIARNFKRSKLVIFLVTYWERFLIKKCAFSIMVNDSIADEVQKIHKLKKRPIVVRSTPVKWEVDQLKSSEIRKEFFGKLNSRVKVLLMYHGFVCNGRGIEEIIKTVASNDEYGAVIIGNPITEKYYDSLCKLVKSYEIDEKIIFHPAVPNEELVKYIGAADISMSIIIPVAKSYYYALPNKLFESIQSETPIIVSNLPEMSRIVQEYGVGYICKDNQVESICQCIEELCDEENRMRIKLNLKKAKEELCWEEEKKVIEYQYRQLMLQKEEKDS